MTSPGKKILCAHAMLINTIVLLAASSISSGNNLFFVYQIYAKNRSNNKKKLVQKPIKGKSEFQFSYTWPGFTGLSPREFEF